METLPAADSSVQECYVFRTTAGVRYTVESSNDLTHWTAEEEIYGLGNEYVVTMRQFTPPPPPPPGGPPITFPPPAKNVSIRMQRSSAAEGGTVVSWPSLDHGGPVVVRIAGEMVTEWFQIPLYFERFANHYFFVWHPNAAASPPAVNSILGANDTAMLAVLESSLPIMNEQVITSVAAVRNAPALTPVPVDPDSKRFWRIFVDSGIDTDSDGTPDWSEFEMAANAAAGHPVRTIGTFPNGAAPTGNPFDSDSNGDGIPDSEQLDTDRDGKADAFDIATSDATASYDIRPLPRYALFEIPGNALQISDLGTVLYSDKTWKSGTITDLPGGPAGASPASGRGINDLDVIIGTEGRNPSDPANPQHINGKICFWPNPSLPYQYVHVPDKGEDVFAYRQHDGFGTQGPAPILSLSGQFIAHGHVLDPEPDYVDEFGGAPTLWQLPTASSGANRQAIPPPALPDLPFVPFNTITQLLPDGGTAIFATPLVDFTNSTDGQANKVYLEGKWQETPTFGMALDISSDGTAIGQAHGGINAPILLNGEWTDIKRYAPGAPSEWADINTDLLDTTPSGWVLGKRNNGTNAGANGVLLPLRVDGVNNTASPANLADPAGGVDRISMGARSGTGHVPEIWIMAPVSGSNPVRFRAPLNAVSTLKLQCNKVTFTTDTLNTADQQFKSAPMPPPPPLRMCCRS